MTVLRIMLIALVAIAVFAAGYLAGLTVAAKRNAQPVLYWSPFPVITMQDC